MSHSRCGILEHRKKTFRRKQHYAALVTFPGSTTKLAISLVRSLRSQVPPLITHNAQKNHHHLDPTHAHTRRSGHIQFVQRLSPNLPISSTFVVHRNLSVPPNRCDPRLARFLAWPGCHFACRYTLGRLHVYQLSS